MVVGHQATLTKVWYSWGYKISNEYPTNGTITNEYIRPPPATILTFTFDVDSWDNISSRTVPLSVTVQFPDRESVTYTNTSKITPAVSVLEPLEPS